MESRAKFFSLFRSGTGQEEAEAALHEAVSPPQSQQCSSA